MSNYAESESYLQKSLDIILKIENEDLSLYTHYANIVHFYMKTNIDRALQILSALLSKNQRHKIPFNFQNDFLFLIGVE